MEGLISGITGLFSGLLNFLGNLITNSQQRAHDKEMASVQLANQKELMDYQTDIAQNTNTIATQKGHMAAAGLNPALMYGSMSPAGLQDVSGSATASASSLSPLQLFDKIPVSDLAQTFIQKRQQDLLEKDLFSQANLRASQIQLNNVKSLEQSRDTHFKRTMEKVVYDQAQAQLELTNAQRSNMDFLTKRGNMLLPGELEQQGLINSQTAAKTNQIVTDTAKSRTEMSLIRADIARVEALTENLGTQSELNREQLLNVQESLRSSALGRIMSEFGLNAIKIPPSMRNSAMRDPLHSNWYSVHKEQINGAMAALVSLGFNPEEAAHAVVFYCSGDTHNTGLANALARVASAGILKK